MLQKRENMLDVDRALETIIGTTGRFNEFQKYVSCYLEAFEAEMLMRGILEVRKLIGLSKLVVLSLHLEILELQAESRNW